MPDYAASVQAVGLRISKLAPTGAPLVGTTTCYTTKAFTRFSWTPEYEEGEEISTVNGSGERCVYYKVPDTIKEVTSEIEICNPQPELYEILGGGTLLVDGSDTVGWAMPDMGSVVNLDGVSIEVWSRAIVNGRLAATNPYWRWVMPAVATRLEGDRTLENGALASVFSGTGQGNENFGTGPGDDWDHGGTQALEFARDASAISAEGYFPVTAPA